MAESCAGDAQVILLSVSQRSSAAAVIATSVSGAAAAEKKDDDKDYPAARSVKAVVIHNKTLLYII